MEIGVDSNYFESIPIPKRPKWDYSMSKQQLEANEKLMFKEYVEMIYSKHPRENLSYFELNLQVWRQLWRVCEMSDIILFVVDIRHPLFHFPQSLYEYITIEMKRSMILVFNKIDLVSKETTWAWKCYFKEKFPNLHVASFSMYNSDGFDQDDSTVGKKR
jgi:ribosome biogenesis GTPase A